MKIIDILVQQLVIIHLLSDFGPNVSWLNFPSKYLSKKLVLLWAQLTKIYPLLPTSVQPISITKTLLIVATKNERDPPLFTGKLLIKFQNILRNTTRVIIRHRVKILFSVISNPITLERHPRNEVVGGYTGFTMSVRPSVDKSYAVQ
jgi:hypothetical protein